MEKKTQQGFDFFTLMDAFLQKAFSLRNFSRRTWLRSEGKKKQLCAAAVSLFLEELARPARSWRLRARRDRRRGLQQLQLRERASEQTCGESESDERATERLLLKGKGLGIRVAE